MLSRLSVAGRAVVLAFPVRTLFLCFLTLFCITACGNGGDGGVKGMDLSPSAANPGLPATAPAVEQQPQPGSSTGQVVPPQVHGQAAVLLPAWQDLRRRLAADGLGGARVDALLATLGPLTQSPMGRKMKELYARNFLPKPAPVQKPHEVYYKGVVTPANAEKCRAFINANRQAFDAATKRYGVPSSIAAALLFVETRLGTVLGDVPENAFQTLASMAESRSVEDISGWTGRMPGWEQHRDWFSATMPKRADWAYAETKALVKYMLQSGVAPERLQGSIYGAVGLCQFMPSNLSVYGADGNGDGVVDLFTVPDAVMSLSKYLAMHGWKPGISREAQHRLLMTYNHAAIYANTILALADLTATQH